jgi:hypothetical protein
VVVRWTSSPLTVLDGEIVCLDSRGRPQFRDLLFRRAEPHFYAFDILWEEHPWSDDEQERRRFRKCAFEPERSGDPDGHDWDACVAACAAAAL